MKEIPPKNVKFQTLISRNYKR